MIELKNISMSYGTHPIVKDVSVTAKAGDFIALVGPNGSGKSSLLKSIAGLLPHDGTTNLSTDRRVRAKQLAYLAQNSSAPLTRTVRDIVSLGRTPHIGTFKKLRPSDQNIIEKALKDCGIHPFADRQFGTLSGGEQSRVHLARALATGAPLLLVDEPITALDPYYQLFILDVLRKAARNGTTVIMAIHDLTLATKFCDRAWVMQAGELVADGSAREALSEAVLKDVFLITPDGNIAT